LTPGEKYFLTRNNTTLAAFIVGKGCATGYPENFRIVGCHTDSPCIRIAPISKLTSCDFAQLAI